MWIGTLLVFLCGCGVKHPSIVVPRLPVIPIAADVYAHYPVDVAAYNAAVEGNGSTACFESPGTPGAASQLAFCIQPGAGTAGQPVSLVAVQVQDANGKGVMSSTSAITLSSKPAGVGGTATANAVNGVATFSSLTFDSAGTYTLSASSSGLVNATSSSITILAAGSPLPASSVDLDRAKYFRNKIAYNFMGEIDYVYGRYVGNLFTAKATEALLGDFESLGLTAASAISLVARTKTILASLATGVAGVNLSADKNFFGQQAFQALAIAMQARRDQARATILTNLQSSVIDYPLAAVRENLVSYFYAGTLPGALQEIQEEAAKSSDDAAKKTQGTTPTPPQPAPNTNPPAEAGNQKAPAAKPSMEHLH
jgi:hypothetical protein